jgi:hypothetical protein
LPEQPPPGELLVEQLVERPQSDPYAKRVHRDGAVHEYSSAVAGFEDGEWRFGTQPLEWRPLVTLAPQAVAELEGLIRSEGVLDLPSEHRPRGTSIGGSDVTWTVELDGRRREIRLLGVGPDAVPALAALDRALQLAVAQAIEREAAAGS